MIRRILARSGSDHRLLVTAVIVLLVLIRRLSRWNKDIEVTYPEYVVNQIIDRLVFVVTGQGDPNQLKRQNISFRKHQPHQPPSSPLIPVSREASTQPAIHIDPPAVFSTSTSQSQNIFAASQSQNLLPTPINRHQRSGSTVSGSGLLTPGLHREDSLKFRHQLSTPANSSIQTSSTNSSITNKAMAFQKHLSNLEKIKRDLLQKVRCFSGLPEGFYSFLVKHLMLQHFPSGAEIITQGDYGECMYFIASGTIAVSLPNKGETVATLRYGQFFGEMALLDGTVRSATCAAVEECDLLVLSRDAFLDAIGIYPAAKDAFLHTKVENDVLNQFPSATHSDPEVQKLVKEKVAERLDALKGDKAANKVLTWSRKQTIGQGASAVVYSAVDSAGRDLAVKVFEGGRMNAKMKQAVERESDLMQRLRHPNLLEGYGVQFGEKTTELYVLMEMMKGGSLSSYIQNLGPMPEAQAQRYARQLLEGLDYLHSQGVLHRDLKPANLLLDESQSVLKLADFGIAKLMGGSATCSQTLAGTPAYMAPEAIHGRYSVFSDVWGAGCTVLELLTGLPPYSNQKTANGEVLTPMQLIFYLGTTDTAPNIPPVGNVADEQGCISEMAFDFLTKTLALDPTSRGTCQELLQHEWLNALNLPNCSTFIMSDNLMSSGLSSGGTTTSTSTSALRRATAAYQDTWSGLTSGTFASTVNETMRTRIMSPNDSLATTTSTSLGGQSSHTK